MKFLLNQAAYLEFLRFPMSKHLQFPMFKRQQFPTCLLPQMPAQFQALKPCKDLQEIYLGRELYQGHLKSPEHPQYPMLMEL